MSIWTDATWHVRILVEGIGIQDVGAILMSKYHIIVHRVKNFMSLFPVYVRRNGGFLFKSFQIVQCGPK